MGFIGNLLVKDNDTSSLSSTSEVPIESAARYLATLACMYVQVGTGYSQSGGDIQAPFLWVCYM